jgi:hypothetical protein
LSHQHPLALHWANQSRHYYPCCWPQRPTKLYRIPGVHCRLPTLLLLPIILQTQSSHGEVQVLLLCGTTPGQDAGLGPAVLNLFLPTVSPLALYHLWLADAYHLHVVKWRIQTENGNYAPSCISDHEVQSWRSATAHDTMAALFPMAQVAHIHPDTVISSTVALSVGSSLADPPHVVQVTDPSHANTHHSGSTPSDGQMALSLSAAGSHSHLSTDIVLAKMRSQMAVKSKQKATPDRRDKTHHKYRVYLVA